ncbi:MAG: 4'-phosphopantetheinyl transferase superfamily protein [Myxococcales bacterium]|nr:4'-phosphopantetheinyl transferase superfamily protein [Myxococcales bacterium]
MAERRELAEGEVHVYWARPEQILDPDLLAAYRAMLDDEERRRHGCYLFNRHRHLYLVSHALARVTLSAYAGAPPAALQFTIGPHGRPDLDPAHGLGRLRHNLSHTDGLAVCAVARGDIGVDVEDTSRRSSGISIAEHFFAAPEVAALRALPEPAQRDRFFDYWTLKEAYIKARGMGLALPLGDFAYTLGGPEIQIGFSGTIEDDPAAWRFRLLEPGRPHRIAVALRRGAGLTVRCFESVPLLSTRPVDL